MMEQVTADTISLERLREMIKAAELLADNELDMIIPFAEYTVYAEAIKRDLVDILERRESAEYRMRVFHE